MPDFFKKFGKISYSIDGYSKDAMNIVTAAILKQVNIDQSYVYQSYDVPAGMSPEALAYQLYKDATLGWVFFLVNGMVNPINDWPMDDSVLEEYTLVKYGNIYKILYFNHLSDGSQADDVEEAAIREAIEDGDPIPFDVTPITALEYESEDNRRRGRISIIAPRYINTFVDLFNKTIAGQA